MARGLLLLKLADALRGEWRMLVWVRAILLRQRAAIEARSVEELHECLYAAQRLLLTLGEARRRREAIAAALGIDSHRCVPRLLAALGPDLPVEVRSVAGELELQAHELMSEIHRSRALLAAPAASAS